MAGRSSQRKGADGERELAALLREYGYPVERGGKFPLPICAFALGFSTRWDHPT